MSLVVKCINFMIDKGSSELRLVAGKPPAIKMGDGFRGIAPSAVAEDELVHFLMDALSIQGAALRGEGPDEYPFDGANAPVKIVKRRVGGTLSLQIVPYEEEIGLPEGGTSAAGAGAKGVGNEAAINRLFRIMIAEKASDLHLSTGSPPYLRKDGEMAPLKEPPFTSEKLHGLLMEITPEKNQRQFEEKRDTDFAYEIAGLARFRSNLFVDRKGCGAVFRQIPTKILTCDELGLGAEIQRLCFLSKGLVLVTGPTGSGKSTTLAALVDHINRNRSDHIITIEDPIEFVHENKRCLINQREVGEHTMGFKNALRAALREDPDIVLVGEMRDLETIGIAIETAETGHLVFGTLHTTTAVSTVDRIIDQFPPSQQEQIRVMLSESLRGVIAQTLCKKNGGGRVAALEVMLYNRAIANLIREGKNYQIPSIMQSSKKDGMVMLNDALVSLVERKVVSADEAYIKSVDKESIRPILQGKGLTIK